MSLYNSGFSHDRRESVAESGWTATSRHVDGRMLRKSCDRCHQQKLRCVGNKALLLRCLRCQRVGAECVYSARSSKQSSTTNNEVWDNGHDQPATSTWNPSLNGLERLDSDLVQLDDFFSEFSSSRASTDPVLLSGHALPPALGADTSKSSTSTSEMSSRCSTVAGAATSSTDATSEVPEGLECVFHALEATFRKVTSEHTKQATQDYPVGEIFSGFDRFSRALASDDTAAIATSRAPRPPFEQYLRTKRASMAAQCYVLCIKLMVSLSEQMLQSLLASPLPTPRPPFNPSTLEAPQNAKAPGPYDDNLSNMNHVPENLRLRDLYVAPTDPFDHAINSTVNMLQLGSRLLGRMETLLEMPPELGGGDMSSVTAAKEVEADQHLRRSLPARFVASIWEEETSINNKCSVQYLRRCRAAILGLAKQDH